MRTFSLHVPFDTLFPPCSATDIAELERYFGYPLPEDYRDFLLQHNGLLFHEYAIFSIARPSSPITPNGTAGVLLGLSATLDYYDLRSWTFRDGFDFKDRVPDHIKVICTSVTDRYITMSLGLNDYGRIYVWDPCMDWDVPESYHKDYSSLRLCGESFSSWWSSLRYRAEPDLYGDDDE